MPSRVVTAATTPATAPRSTAVCSSASAARDTCGIGFALAERAAKEGMTVVLSDIETTALEAAAGGLRDRGFKVMSQRLDVSNEAEVEALAKRVYDELGAVHLLCNNAGVLNRERP